MVLSRSNIISNYKSIQLPKKKKTPNHLVPFLEQIYFTEETPNENISNIQSVYLYPDLKIIMYAIFSFCTPTYSHNSHKIFLIPETQAIHVIILLITYIPTPKTLLVILQTTLLSSSIILRTKVMFSSVTACSRGPYDAHHTNIIQHLRTITHQRYCSQLVHIIFTFVLLSRQNNGRT